jgi:ribosomal protein L39E
MGMRTLDYNAYMREWRRKNKRRLARERRAERTLPIRVRRIAHDRIRQRKVEEMRDRRSIDA